MNQPTLDVRSQNRKRNAQVLSGVLVLLLTFLLVLNTVNFVKTNAPQDLILTLLGLVTLFAWIIAFVLIRRGRTETGMMIGLAISLLAYAPVSFLAPSSGVISGLILALGATFISGLTLGRRPAIVFIILSILTGAFIIVSNVLLAEGAVAFSTNQPLFLLVVLGLFIFLSFIVLRQFRLFSINTQLLIAFVTLAALAVGVLTYVVTLSIRSALTQQVAEDLGTNARSAALSVGITMDRNVDRLQSVSLDKSVQDEVTLIVDSYPPTIAGRDDWIKAKEQQWAANKPGDIVVQSVLGGKLAYSLRQFGDVFKGNQELFMTDAYGSVIAATDWQEKYNYADQGWWKIAYGNGIGNVYIGQPEFDTMLGKYGIRMVIPIFAPGRQRVVGVVHSIYTLDALQRVLLLNSFEGAGKVDLLFPLGQILTADGTFRQLNSEEFTEIKDSISQSLPTVNYRGTPLLSAQGVVGVSDDQPEPYLRSSAWRTIATIPESEALSVVADAVQSALLTGIGTVGAAIVVALLFARFLTRPIRRLTSVAEEIQGGNLAARAPIESGDEIGTLARTFNTMTSQLQETLGNLERRVTDRTRELSEANRALQANSAYLSALNDTSAGLFERFDLKDLLQKILDSAGALLDTHDGFVFFKEANESDIQMRVGSGLYDDLIGTRAQAGVGMAGTVWQSGEPMVIEDYQKWEGRLPGSRRDALRAIVAVPLKRGVGQGASDDETVGVLGLAYTDGTRKFGKTEVEILQRFAQLASIALDNAKLYANSEERVRELGALNTISQYIVQPSGQLDVVERVGEEITHIFDADFGYFALYNSETRMIDFPYGLDNGKRVNIPSMPIGQGITSQVITSRQPLLLTHATADDYERMGAVDSGDGSSPKSLMAVPIPVGDTVIGALSVQRLAPERPYSPEDQTLLTTIAANIGVSVQNTRLALATQQRVQELSALNRVSTYLSTAEPLNDRLREVGRELIRIFQVSSVYISRYDPARNLVTIPYFIEDGIESEVPPAERTTGFISHILDTRRPLVINDHLLERFQELGGIWIGNTTTNPLSYLGVPIMAGDRMYGVVALNANPEGRFSEADTRFLSTIASAIGTAMDNERLGQETTRRLEELGVLNQVSSILTSNQPLVSRLAAVGRTLQKFFVVDGIVISTYDPATNLVHYPFAAQAHELNLAPSLKNVGFAAQIIDSRKPLVINDEIETRMAELGTYWMDDGTASQSYVGVPILLGNQVLGVLNLTAKPKHYFEGFNVDLLLTIGSAIASALQNAQLLEQTQERARELDAVNSLAREITQQRSLDDLFQEVYFQIKTVTSVDGLLMSLYDDRTDTLSVPFLMDEGARYEITPDALAMEREFADQVRTGEPVMINSTPEEVAELEKSPAVAGNGRASRSRLYVPLMAGVRFLGMISLHSYTYNAYSERDIAVLTGLASHIAIALENARLFDQTQAALAQTEQEAKQLTLLNELSLALKQSATLEELLQHTITRMPALFDNSQATVARLTDDPDFITLYMVLPDSEELVSQPVPRENSLGEVTLRQGRISNIQDTRNAHFSDVEFLSEMGIRSYMVLPLLGSTMKSFGTLNIASREPNQFQTRHERLAQQVALTVSAEIENRRLFEQTQGALAATEQQAQALARLNHGSNQLAAAATFEEIVQITDETLQALLSPERVTFALSTADGSGAQLYGVQGEVGVLPVGTIFQMQGSTVQRAIMSNQIVYTPDLRTDFNNDSMRPLIDAGYRSVITAPLVVQGTAIGALNVNSKEPNRFSSQDLNLVSQVASIVSTTLENRQLIEQTQAALQETQVLYEFGAQLNQVRTLDELLDLASRSAFENGARTARLLLVESDAAGKPEFSLIAASKDRNPDAVSPVGTRFRLANFAVTKIIEASIGAPVISEDIRTDPRFDPPSRAQYERLGDFASVLLPLTYEGRWLAFFIMNWSEAREFSAAERRFYQSMLAPLSLAVSNRLAFEQTQEALAETNYLYRIAEAANEEVDEQAFYKRVHEVIAEAMPANSFYIVLNDPDEDTLDFVYYADETQDASKISTRKVKAENRITAYVLRTRKPLRATRSQIEEMVARGEVRVFGNLSADWMGVPIFRGDTPIGVLTVQNYAEGHHYTEQEEHLLVRLSQAIANAIERKRAEAALRNSEAQLAETMRLTRLGNWEYDVASDTFIFTEEFYSMMRTTAEREGGYTMSSRQYAERFVYPEDMPLVGFEVQEALQTADPNYQKQIDHRVTFGDGELGYVTVRIRVRKDASGKTVQTYGANLDITERKRAENELQAALAETQRLADREHAAAAEIMALNRRLTREGWREFAREQTTAWVAEALDGPATFTPAATPGNGSKAHPSTFTVSETPNTVRVPIILRGEEIGTIELEYDDLNQEWSEDRQEMVTDVVENLAFALDNARLHQQTQTALEETRRLADREKTAAAISDRIYSTTDVKTILRIAAEELRRSTGSSRAVLKLGRDKSNQ